MRETETRLAPIPILRGRRILLGVTGSIAAYKAADLASKLTQAGAQVDVMLSRAAEQFVSPLTFRSVTGGLVHGEDDLWGEQGHVLHVELAQRADLLLIAPATANTLAKLAHGLADGLIPLAALAVQCPLLVAPAMDAGMYQHPAVQANVELLRQRGVRFAGPDLGRMASGLQGLGRLVEPDHLIGHIRLALGAEGPLRGRKVVVTAGGTQEAVDAVRVLTNRSSGKQGYALAQAALDRGADVLLISAPATLPVPVGAQLVHVTSADEMQAAVMEAVAGADALLMAAAVADFRPARPSEAKLKKADGVPEIELEATIDILKAVAEQRQKKGGLAVLVGFAAESEALEANASRKLTEKGLDLIVANDITADRAGFEADTNLVTLIEADGSLQQLPLMSKVEVAERVLERVEDLLGVTRSGG